QLADPGHFFRRQLDDRAAAVVSFDHQSAIFELLQRFSHRNRANAKPSYKFTFHQTLARPEPAANDLPLQLIHNFFAQRFGADPGFTDRRWHNLIYIQESGKSNESGK